MEDVPLGMDFLCSFSATFQCGCVYLQIKPLLLTSSKNDSVLSPLSENEYSLTLIDSVEFTAQDPPECHPA